MGLVLICIVALSINCGLNNAKMIRSENYRYQLKKVIPIELLHKIFITAKACIFM